MELEEQKPKDVLLDGREIKQEMEDVLENVKEEPIDEEYSRHLIPKFEETMEPSASYLPPEIHLKDPLQEFFMQTQTVVPKLDVEPEIHQEELHVESQKNSNIDDSQHHRCSVCLQNCPLVYMKDVTTSVDKLVIMVGHILSGSYTLDQAQWFMSSGRKVFICNAHFSESINKIYEVLNINNSFEITSCPSELMDKLMITVNALIPQMGPSHFSDIVRDFVRRYIPQKRKRQNYHCTVCKQKESSNNMKHVSMQDEKLLLMIGCILRGEYTVKQARFFMSQKKISSICHVHFFQTANEICKFLDLKRSDGIWPCSNELLANLMITVNELCPWITTTHFCHLFNEFMMRSKKFLDRVMSSTRQDFEDQKAKNILLTEGEIKQETEVFWENVKEEPKEKEYYEEIISKFKGIIESSPLSVQAIHLTSLEQNFFMQAPTSVPKLDVEAAKVQKKMHVEPQSADNNPGFQTHRCSLCLQICPLQDMKHVSTEEDKLVILVGCVLRGTYTLDQAQLFMSGRQTLYICCVHFSESINKVYNVLDIKNNGELTSCSSDLMDNLMITVTALSPQIEIWQFCNIVHKFVKRNISQKRIKAKGEQNKKQLNYHCSLCTEKQSSTNLKKVTMETEKLVIMVGCALRGDHSLDQAQLHMSRKLSMRSTHFLVSKNRMKCFHIRPSSLQI